LSLHPIDLGEVGRDEVITAALAAIRWKLRCTDPTGQDTKSSVEQYAARCISNRKPAVSGGFVYRIGMGLFFGVICGGVWPDLAILCEHFQLPIIAPKLVTP
jgi:hypothetical protein